MQRSACGAMAHEATYDVSLELYTTLDTGAESSADITPSTTTTMWIDSVVVD
jgi:hypothetical protein